MNRRTTLQSVLTMALLLCQFLSVYAQKNTGNVSGVVLDAFQKLSLPGASLTLSPGNRYTISNEYGKYLFLDVPAGKYTLEVTYIGYKTFSVSVEVKSGESSNVICAMEEGAIAGKEVVVLGDRLRGQARAINQQKNYGNITNIVSADQIGRFPDANIGDAIKRIPGITMQNDQGEARNIIIRGLAPELNSVMLNGDRIPSAEGDNRRVQMDLIPSDMIQTIEVNKTLTPDMDADAIGGSVNLITRAAPNVERISGTISAGYNPIRNKPLYTGSFVYGNRFLQQRLGVVLSGSYNNNDYGSDNVEAVWAQDDFGNVFIEEFDIRKYDVQRVRRSGALALDYTFSPNSRIYANLMYNWRDDWENRFRWRATDIEPLYDVNDNITGYEGAIRAETKGGIDSRRVKSRRLEEQKVQNYALRGEHLLGTKLNLDWAASYSKASEFRPNERYMQFETEGVAFSRSFESPRFPLISPLNAVPADAFELIDLSENTDLTTEDELGLRLNFRLPFSLVEGQKGRIRFGGRLRLKNKDRNNTFNEFEPLTGDYDNLSLVRQVRFDGNNWNPSSKYQPGTFVDPRLLGGLALNNPALFNTESVPDEFLALNYTARETILAGYVRYDQSFSDKLSMISGVRFENTSINYTGNIIEDEDDLQGQRTIKNSYLNILPSLTFRYNATKDLVLRAAVTTSIARPNYYTLSPFVSSIPDDDEVQAGNPDLKASYAWNFDFMAEYYFKSVGLVSGGVFYKNVNNFIYTFRDEQLTTAKFADQFPGVNNPVPNGSNWTLIQARNGDQVNVYGFEVAIQRQLDFLPGKFLKGFNLYTNYTYTKSSADGIYSLDGDLRTGIALPGTAPHMFNLSLAWENKRFSSRISLNYAAAYIDELGGDAFGDRFYDKQTFLDANASYVLSKSLRIFAEANNLTNTPLRYYQGISERTMQMEYYQPRFNAGLKFDLSR